MGYFHGNEVKSVNQHEKGLKTPTNDPNAAERTQTGKVGR
jgi:hypothetical protein